MRRMGHYYVVIHDRCSGIDKLRNFSHVTFHTVFAYSFVNIHVKKFYHGIYDDIWKLISQEKTRFSGNLWSKKTNSGHFNRIRAPAVPENLASCTGNVHRIRKTRRESLKSYFTAKIPWETSIHRVQTGRTLFSGWRSSRNTRKQQKINRKTLFTVIYLKKHDRKMVRTQKDSAGGACGPPGLVSGL